MHEPDEIDLIRALTSIISAFDSSVGGLINEIAGLRSSGIVQDQIKIRVDPETSGGTDPISLELAAKVKAEAEKLQQRIFQFAQNRVIDDELKDPDPRLFWNAVLSNTCPDCMNRHGHIKLRSEWEAIGLPGQGGTVCRSNCRCTLLPVLNAQKLYKAPNENSLTRKSRAILNIRASEIKAEERRRGKEFAASTYNAKLGQARTRGLPLGILVTE